MSVLVDFHAHLLARPFFELLADRSPREGNSHEILGRVAAAADIELPPADTTDLVERWIGELDRYHVQHLVLATSLPEEAKVAATAIAAWGSRVTAFATLDPIAPGADETARALLEEGGFRGVLLFPSHHGYPLASPRLTPVLEVLAEHAVPVLVHCGLSGIPLYERFGIPRPPGSTIANPLDLIPVAHAFPRIPFVIPELGGGFLREALMAGRLCENLHLDTSSSHRWRETNPGALQLADVFEAAINVFGPERILFGTDSCVFPRGWRHDRLTAQREALGACGIDEMERARILGENAAALLRLDR